MSLELANAPCSFGAFELSDPAFVRPDPAYLIAQVAHLGYRGIDLGDVGYLGTGRTLTERLRRHAITLAGGWIQLPFADDEAYQASVGVLDQTLDLFDAAPRLPGLALPKPTLAVASRPIRAAHPGGGAVLADLALPAAGWAALGRNVNNARRRCADRGYQATFHHHVGTDVESPAEIDRFLDISECDLTLDTGHLLVGGGQPVAGLRRWRNRINHVHFKDARSELIRTSLAAGTGMAELWDAGVFVPVGKGDLDVAAFARQLLDTGYHGWVVVEQDVVLHAGDTIAQALADQRRNFAALTAVGLGRGPHDTVTR